MAHKDKIQQVIKKMRLAFIAFIGDQVNLKTVKWMYQVKYN